MKRTFHEVIIFGDFFRCARALNFGQRRIDDVGCDITNVTLREPDRVIRFASKLVKEQQGSQELRATLNEKDPFDCNRRIRIADVICRSEMAKEEREDRDQLFFC